MFKIGNVIYFKGELQLLDEDFLAISHQNCYMGKKERAKVLVKPNYGVSSF